MKNSLWIVAAVGLAGCDPSPTQNILGSFFPSWMLCVLAALAATAAVHRVLALLRLEQSLPAPLLTYLAMIAAFSFGLWLQWLG
jgi:hypothetical protein